VWQRPAETIQLEANNCLNAAALHIGAESVEPAPGSAISPQRRLKNCASDPSAALKPGEKRDALDQLPVRVKKYPHTVVSTGGRQPVEQGLARTNEFLLNAIFNYWQMRSI